MALLNDDSSPVSRVHLGLVFLVEPADGVVEVREVEKLEGESLSLEAMRQRLIPVLGIAFIGDAHPDTEQIIVEMGGVRSLGRLPRLDPLTPGALRRSFQAHFDISLFRTMKT